MLPSKMAKLPRACGCFTIFVRSPAFVADRSVSRHSIQISLTQAIPATQAATRSLPAGCRYRYFPAAMLGALKGDHLGCLLTESGEMRRWKEAERQTPEALKFFIPPPPVDADALSRLAESATRLEQLDDTSPLEEH
jgi:hypothetical protein